MTIHIWPHRVMAIHIWPHRAISPKSRSPDSPFRACFPHFAYIHSLVFFSKKTHFAPRGNSDFFKGAFEACLRLASLASDAPNGRRIAQIRPQIRPQARPGAKGPISGPNSVYNHL